MTESEFSDSVVELAHMFGWRVAAFRPARTTKGWRTAVRYDGAGYPDLSMAHPNGTIILAELKVKAPLSDVQKVWSATLALSGVYRLWRPSDGDVIVRELSFGRVLEWKP